MAGEYALPHWWWFKGLISSYQVRIVIIKGESLKMTEHPSLLDGIVIDNV